MEDEKTMDKDENDTCRWFNDKMLTIAAPTTCTACFVTPLSLFSLPSLTTSLSLPHSLLDLKLPLLSLQPLMLLSLTCFYFISVTPSNHQSLFPLDTCLTWTFYKKKIKSLISMSGCERSCENWLLKYH